MSTKAIYDKMGPSGLVPSLLVFCTLPKFPCISKFSPKQAKRFEALKPVRKEMETKVAKSRNQMSLQSRLSRTTKYFIVLGDVEIVFRKITAR